MEVPPVQTVTEPDGLEVSFKNMTGLRQEDGTAVKEVLSEGSRIYVYDGFRFLLKGNKDAYYYLLLSDIHGKAHLLFHGPGDHPDNVSDETEYSIPLEAHLLRLDEGPAAQFIYILASESRLEEIEPVLWEIEKLSENSTSGHMETDRSGYEIVVRLEIANGRVNTIK